MKIVLVIVLSTILLWCSYSEDRAIVALKKHGYTQVKIDGYRWIGCQMGDDFHTGFEAISPKGVRVTGVVCFGVLKEPIINIDP